MKEEVPDDINEFDIEDIKQEPLDPDDTEDPFDFCSTAIHKQQKPETSTSWTSLKKKRERSEWFEKSGALPFW